MPPEIKTILAMQADYLGDIICTTPALRALRELYPRARINLLTSPQNKPYVDTFPFVNEITYFENPLHFGRQAFGIMKLKDVLRQLHKEQYDLTLEFTGRLPNQIFLVGLKSRFSIGLDPTNSCYFLDRRLGRLSEHQTKRNLDLVQILERQLSVRDAYAALWNPATQGERKRIKEWLGEHSVVGSFAVVHPFGSWRVRHWHHEKWKKVAHYLITKGFHVILVGGSEEYSEIEALRTSVDDGRLINTAGALSIGEMSAIFKNATLFLGNDSGPMHLAAVAGLRGVVLFGPGDPKRWKYPFHVGIHSGLPCSPCPQFAFRSTCVQGHKTCKGLDSIGSAEVIDACDHLLRGSLIRI